ncbi:carbohydrate kinase family protein [Marivita hallyeonensis]|uniref:Fructokinase n=1 Tax=Marivita hallyeonensis TaxID=996342 RepID=A0A1M5X4A9_9RHOB|nr:carbohydrate kinase [Marivita hallyeonensis]SHH94649.1 fructokinase [Marivita hallyeonensis]
MTNSPIICVGGENLIDHVTRESNVSALPGGSPFNVAMALGRQDVDVRYITPISTDSWGDLLADTLTRSGVTLSGGRVDAPTTVARVTVTDGIPSYEFERNGTAERRVTEQSLFDAMPAQTRALHTGSLAVSEGADGAAWEDACKRAFDDGTLVSFDPNVRLSVISDPERYRARVLRMMATTHLLKLSDEDLEGLFPDLAAVDALTEVRALTSAPLVVMTKGPDGAMAWIGEDVVDMAAPPVPNLVDTVGAGDTFMATLLAGLVRIDALSPTAVADLSRDDVETLIRRAGMAAAINCGRAGCNPPTVAELDAALGI